MPWRLRVRLSNDLGACQGRHYSATGVEPPSQISHHEAAGLPLDECKIMPAYQELETIFARSAIVDDVIGLLGWDTETMMPPGAIEGRSEQMSVLEDVSHEALTSPATSDLLEAALEDQSELSDWQKANLREMRRAHIRATAIPRDLLMAASKANALCQHAWRGARKENDYGSVKEQLREVLRLQRETGAAVGEALGLGAYDALQDQFDPGATGESTDRLFAPVRAALPDLIQRALDRQASAPQAIAIDGPFARDRQERLCRLLLDRLSFDFDHGRLDVSAHPFTGGAFGDVRVTTRFTDDTILPSLLATIHEGGHALYEQGRPSEWWKQPVGRSHGMAVHESQSMIIELQAGRNEHFLSYLLPLVRVEFEGKGAAWTDDNMRRVALRVSRGFIRVDSDELTYPAHILVRYEIERAMIAGDLSVDDLPSAFNAAVEKYLGLKVLEDRDGCLQDIHWYGGAFGYFPAYLIGAMIASQLFEAARVANPDIEPSLSKGEFGPLVSWLRGNIHSKGSLLGRDDLIAAATGSPPSADQYLRHLERRYVG